MWGTLTPKTPFCKLLDNLISLFISLTEQFPNNLEAAGYTVLYGITMAAALTGNSLLIFIIKRRPDTRSITGFLFVNMAVADLLVTSFVMPVSIAWLYSGGKWLTGILGHITCTLVYFIFYVTLAASILSLSLMSVDRYLAVIFPLRRFPKFRRPKVLAVVVWLSSMVFSVPIAVVWRLVEFKPLGIFFCSPQFEQLGEFGMKGYYIYLVLLMYLIPLFMISSLYVLVGRALWRRNVPGVTSTETKERNKKTKLIVVRMLAVITAAFALCWLPAQCYHLILAFRPDIHDASPPYVMFLCFWSGHANSALNPWLYIMLNDKFRKVIWRVISRARSGSNPTSAEGNLVSRLIADPIKETNVWKPQTAGRPVEQRNLFHPFVMTWDSTYVPVSN